MNLKFMCAILLSIFFIHPPASGIVRTELEYFAPRALTAHNVDGVLNIVEWANALAVPLYYHLPNSGSDPWSYWLVDENEVKDIMVVWQAEWSGNVIHFSAVMIDDVWGRANNPDGNNLINLHRDDGFHIWTGREVNVFDPNVWNRLRNFLIGTTGDQTSFYVQDSAVENFRSSDFSDNFVCHRVVLENDFVWFIEADITRTDSVDPFHFGQYVMFEVQYNDADEEPDWERKLAWNTGFIPAEFSQKPWQNPGKLIFDDPDVLNTNRDYVVFKPEKIFFNLDGFLDEYDNMLPTILSSFQNKSEAFVSSNKNRTHENLTSVQQDSSWYVYTDYKNAAVIWRAAWIPDSMQIYFAFEIYDDYYDGNESKLSPVANLINDDGVNLWIDFNNDATYDTSKFSNDVNIFIHYNGKISQRSLISEDNFNIPFIGENIKAAADTTGIFRTIELKVNIPKFFTMPADSTLRVEIAYNDADVTRVRERQLMWSNTSPSIKPYKDFDNLGVLRFTRKKKYIGIHDSNQPFIPENHHLHPNYPNPFNAQTIIPFSLSKKEKVTIRVYNLLGQQIVTLTDQFFDPGQHRLMWNGADDTGEHAASGVYLIVMEAEQFRQAQKIVLMK